VLDETELGVGSLNQDDGRLIVKAFVTTTDGTTKIKNKGKTWVLYDNPDGETLLWKSKSVGMIRSHSIIEDSTGSTVATVITEKKGMASCTNYICRSVPSFDGQEPLTKEELKKAAIKDEEVVLYKFSKIETNRKMTTAKCTYGIVTGKEEIKTLYEGEKLSSMGFKAIFKEINDSAETVVAKAYMPGMSMSPHLDAAIGVDLLAVVSMGYSLAGDDNAAGAMAGAGVV